MIYGMATLHEIAMQYAKKQPGMIDCLLERTPILDMTRWKATTHGLYNLAEVLTDVKGAGFIKPESPFPRIGTSSDLIHVDLAVMGGRDSVPSMKAQKLGGWKKYFADRQKYILSKTGMNIEIQLIEDNWLKGALTDGTHIDCGGTGDGYYMLAVRFDEACNVGLYDADQFAAGRFITPRFPYDGAEHYLPDPGYEGVLGYEIVYEGRFGWQMLDAARTVACCYNITDKKIPTPMQIDDLLMAVRAEEGPTYLFMPPKAKSLVANSYKLEKVQLANGDTDAKTHIDSWNGIPIKTSYTIARPIPHI